MEPGQKGTRRLLAKYGAALLCVRYRYDEEAGENLTTAESIADQATGAFVTKIRMWSACGLYAEQVLREKLKG